MTEQENTHRQIQAKLRGILLAVIMVLSVVAFQSGNHRVRKKQTFGRSPEDRRDCNQTRSDRRQHKKQTGGIETAKKQIGLGSGMRGV